MTDVSISVSGEMDLPQLEHKKGGQLNENLFQLSSRLPQAKEWLMQRRQHVKPWMQFVQTSNFKPPQSLPRLSKRMVRNLEYFQSNYLFVSLGLVVYCLITSPLLLIAAACSAYAARRLTRRTGSILVCGHELTPMQQYGLAALCTTPILYLAGAGAALFWVLGASISLVALHAAFYNIDALLAEDSDTFGLTQQV